MQDRRETEMERGVQRGKKGSRSGRRVSEPGPEASAGGPVAVWRGPVVVVVGSVQRAAVRAGPKGGGSGDDWRQREIKNRFEKKN